MAQDGDLVALGGDLEPETLVAAYERGLFPMRLGGRRGPLGWWSPDPRGVLPLDGVRVSRSLRRSLRRFEIRIDADFGGVLAGCAAPGRHGAWIGPDIRRAYARLHRLGLAHSVEAWTPDGRLAGGLYGVSLGGLFAGESMFHRERDASKAALVGLVGLLAEDGLPRLLDVQWTTPHLRSLGAVDVPRSDYLARLASALELPPPAPWGGPVS